MDSSHAELIFDKPIRTRPDLSAAERDALWNTKLPAPFQPAKCATCVDLDRRVIWSLEGLRPGLSTHIKDHSVGVQSTMQELAQSVDDGCPSCKLIQLCCLRLGEGHYDPQSNRNIFINLNEERAMVVQLERHGFDPQLQRQKFGIEGSYITLELFSATDSLCPWSMIGDTLEYFDPYNNSALIPGGVGRVVPVDPTSLECMNTVRSWINQCNSEHPYCKSSEPPEVVPQYPRLLIHLGCSSEHLYLQEAGPKTRKYAALSYCWGRSGGRRLLRESFHQLKTRVPISDLAKVIQDAIQIARGLGLQYLWVDALCIVQDDPEGQAAEIMNMASVYANAYLTIAASTSSDGQDSCLLQRAATVKVSITEHDGTKFDIFARQSLSHVAFDYGWDAMESGIAKNNTGVSALIESQFPLFTRGWAWQERLLSPRILHYTKSELIWECLGGITCECGAMDAYAGNRALTERRYALGVPQDVELQHGLLDRSRALAKRHSVLDYAIREDSTKAPSFMYMPLFKTDLALMHAILGRPYVPDFREWNTEHHERWRDVITQFSRRNLTYDTDVLPAVSGLATMWRSRQDTQDCYLAGLWERDLMRGLLWICIDQYEEKDTPRPVRYLAPTWSWASIRRAIGWLTTSSKPVYHATITKAFSLPNGPNVYGAVAEGHIDVSGPALKAVVIYCSETGAFAKPGDLEYNYFSADCLPEARALVGYEVVCFLWATDQIDERTGRGRDRCLILKACQSLSGTYTRVGIMESLPEEWRELFTSRSLRIV